MATGLENQELVPEHLRERLSVAVRSIQWSYAIFWSISTRQQGILRWNEGYYNGDIKTRKTVQAMELSVDQMGLERSKQLRELYESLSAGDASQQTRRPSAALSPEDLTDAEWYYLVCMSFVFNPGEGLPGRVYSNCQPIWLCNAHHADSKVFPRSLLAKSASIQTVVCFPFWGGVIELGVTELVVEEPNLIQHMKTSLLELPKLICPEQSSSRTWDANDGDTNCTKLNHDIINTTPPEKISPIIECEMQPKGVPQAFPISLPAYMHNEELEDNQNVNMELHANICEESKTGSPPDSSNGCGPDQPTEDSFMLDGMNDGTSQVQSWQFMDDEFSNCVHASMNSSDCISQNLLNPSKDVSFPKSERVNGLHIQDLQECNHMKLGSLDLGDDDVHYSRTLSALFKNSHHLIVAPGFNSGNCGSSFKIWRKSGPGGALKPQISNSQKMLKKILFKVPWMHSSCLLKSIGKNGGKNGLPKLEGDEIGVSHMFYERRRQEKLNERFLVLKALIPSISKVDKASILDDTIDYLKELERRISELESCRNLAELESRARRKHPDIVERTSDNYADANNIANGKKPVINKRKACDIDETDSEYFNWALQRDGLAADITIRMIEEEVLIEMRCSWRESLLLDVIDVLSNLHLDVHSVQSSTVDGMLALTLKSKLRGAAVASVGMIKQALQRVVSKC